ncbi:MAG: sugar ABC transporter ATP-binding protein [Ostreibacterium sp.]
MHIVEILRALRPGVKVIAFDEPTSSLTTSETKKLFNLIKSLCSEGLGIIYVSHRMHEVLSISDHIFVLKDGVPAGSLAINEATEKKLVQMMVGRDLASQRTYINTHQREKIVLEATGICSRWHKNVSLELHAGEILGIGGLVGAGRTELAKVLFGAYKKTRGTIKIDGQVVNIQKPSDAIAEHIGFVPENRKFEGLIIVRSVLENASMAILSCLAHFGVLRKKSVINTVKPYIAALDIKTPSLNQEVGKLSGGNQQKVVLARWLAAKPKILILDEPTRAIDVGAKAEIYQLILDLVKQGIGIIMISSEMPELLMMSDRIAVMHEGELSRPISKEQASEEIIMNLALGLGRNKKN